MTREISFAMRPLCSIALKRSKMPHQQNLRTSELIVDFG